MLKVWLGSFETPRYVPTSTVDDGVASGQTVAVFPPRRRPVLSCDVFFITRNWCARGCENARDGQLW